MPKTSSPAQPAPKCSEPILATGGTAPFCHALGIFAKLHEDSEPHCYQYCPTEPGALPFICGLTILGPVKPFSSPLQGRSGQAFDRVCWVKFLQLLHYPASLKDPRKRRGFGKG